MERADAQARGYRFDDVEIDARRHRIVRDGKELPLEPKAYAVLVELLGHAGDVVSRDALLDAVWGHRHVTPAVLNRIIAILRRELGDDAEHPHLIRTVHGIGYEFIGTFEAQLAPPELAAELPSLPESQSPLPQPSSPPASRQAGIPWHIVSWALALLAIVAAAVSWMSWPRVAPPPATATSRSGSSVAVLPLANASGAAEQQFFSDGLSDNLINTLSQYDGLKVIGRGSSFLFRDNKEGATVIGAKLGVDHLVEGSVQRAGDEVRVNIELVRAVDGSVAWTRRFDRPYKDLFALQDDITLAVAGALQVKLLHAMPSMVEAGRPVSGNLDAYEAYLRATADMSSFSYQRAVEEFEQATRIDPGYAQAWSWLALARTLYAVRDGNDAVASAGFAQARREVDTALHLRPDFGQAHAIRANLLRTADHDWNGALAEFRIALPLVSDTDPTHGAMSILLGTLGRVDEAIAERRKYIAGDPLAAFAHIYLAQLLASRGRLDEAAASLRDADQLNTYPAPETRDWRTTINAYIAILRGDVTKALAATDTMKPGRWRERWRTLALQVGVDRAAADAALQRLLEADRRTGDDAYTLARAYALRDDADHAFEWLQRDLDRGGSAMHNVLSDAFLLRFRNDPRFAAWCARAGLPSPQASDALGLDAIRAALAQR